MKTKLLLAALAATFTLAGCGNPASSNAGTDSSNASTVDSAIAWTKKLAHGKSAKANIVIPSSGAIAEALLDPIFVNPEQQGGDNGHINGPRIRALVAALGQQFVIPGFDNHSTLLPVAAIIQPYNGWQINLMSGFGDKKATPKQRNDYLGFQEAAAEYTNTLFTEIASKINSEDIGVMADPEAAKKQIQKIFSAIPKATIEKMWKDATAHAEARQGRTIDMTGSGGVKWSADGGSYAGEMDGLTWTKSGVVWFGKGHLSGKEWTIGLESSISQSADKSSTGTESVNGGTGEKSGSAAQPK